MQFPGRFVVVYTHTHTQTHTHTHTHTNLCYHRIFYASFVLSYLLYVPIYIVKIKTPLIACGVNISQTIWMSKLFA